MLPTQLVFEIRDAAVDSEYRCALVWHSAHYIASLKRAGKILNERLHDVKLMAKEWTQYTLGNRW